MTFWRDSRVRIYGPLGGETSWSRVARGLYLGLQAWRPADFFKTDDIGHSIDTPLRSGDDNEIGLFVGAPNRAGMMLGQGSHQERWLMLAPNSSWLPRDVLFELERVQAVTGYLSPSNWGVEQVRRYTDLPVRCFPHGVDTEHLPLVDEEYPPPPPKGSFRVLHLSSTHLDRKGTQQLVEAWTMAMLEKQIPPDAQLSLVLDGPGAFVTQACRQTLSRITRKQTGLWDEVERTINIMPRLNLDPPGLAKLMQEHHCVCQPSRAEGFGMVPLEARAVGVPVIMTDGTGHGMHVPRTNAVAHGVCVVHQSGHHPINDGPNATAPRFDTMQLVDALTDVCFDALRYRQLARRRAPQVRREWSWQERARVFLGEEDRDG